MPRYTTPLLTIGCCLSLSCESEGPSSSSRSHEPLLFTGQVRLQGGPPDPTILVWAEAYSTDLPTGLSSHTLQLNSTGSFAGAFAPFPNDQIDSLILAAAQPTCDGSVTTVLRYGAYRIAGEILRLPTLDLQYPQPPAGLQAGLEMCGAFSQTALSGPTLTVSLIIDVLADSVFGRYAVGPDDAVVFDQGEVAGQLTDTLLVLQFASEHYPPCVGASLGIPIGHQYGFGLATLTGAQQDFCHITSGQLRLFPHQHGFPPLP